MEFKTAPNSRPIQLHEAEKTFLVLQNVSNKNSWRRLRFKVYFDTTYMCIQCKLKILKNIPPPKMGGAMISSKTQNVVQPEMFFLLIFPLKAPKTDFCGFLAKKRFLGYHIFFFRKPTQKPFWK